MDEELLEIDLNMKKLSTLDIRKCIDQLNLAKEEEEHGGVAKLIKGVTIWHYSWSLFQPPRRRQRETTNSNGHKENKRRDLKMKQLFDNVGSLPLVELQITLKLDSDSNNALSTTVKEALTTTLHGTKKCLSQLTLDIGFGDVTSQPSSSSSSGSSSSTTTLSSADFGFICSLYLHPCLESISLSFSGISVPFLVHLIQAIVSCPKLRTIELGNMETSYNGHSHIVSATSLSSSSAGMEPDTAFLDDLIHSLRALCSSDVIENLEFSGKPFLEGRALKTICGELETNNKVEILEFGESESFDEYHQTDQQGKEDACQAVGKLLKQNTSIKTLTVPASHDLLLSIADALKYNRNLEDLTIFPPDEDYRFPESVLKSFQDMMKHNFVLLDVYDCEHGLSIDPVVSFYIKLNKAGRGMLLLEHDNRKPHNSLAWTKTIVKNKDDTSVVYWFLSQNPSLLFEKKVPSAQERVFPRPHARKRGRLDAWKHTPTFCK